MLHRQHAQLKPVPAQATVARSDGPLSRVQAGFVNVCASNRKFKPLPPVGAKTAVMRQQLLQSHLLSTSWSVSAPPTSVAVVLGRTLVSPVSAAAAITPAHTQGHPTLMQAAQADKQHEQRLTYLDPDRNASIDPSKVTLGSSRLVHLTCRACPCGHPHEWQTPVKSFWLDGKRCPVCTGLKPCRCNSLLAMYPVLCQQWDTAKNEQPPDSYRPSSHAQAWWLCRQHTLPCSWQARIFSRTRSGNITATGCPQCGRDKQRRQTKQPTLAAAGPEYQHLIQQWHPDNDRTPEQVTLGSRYAARWLCPQSACQHPHAWTASVKQRASSRTRCPFCSGHRVCPCNSLQGRAPELLAEWDHAANAALGTPDQFSPGSNVVAAWWHTAADGAVHRWKASIASRCIAKTRCPECAWLRPKRH